VEFANLVLGIALFAATNVDDLFILLAFLSDSKFRLREVAAGQYLGMCVLIAASLVIALVSLALPQEYVGLLGLAPLAIGAKKLLELRSSDTNDDQTARRESGTSGIGNVLSVAAVTVANGGDNVGAYAPLFATRSVAGTAVIVVTFLVMTAVWCWFSNWLVSHRTLGAPIRKYGARALPFVLIGLGLLILYEAGSFALMMVWLRHAPSPA
jgi:cadmium resistance transport/sequestration family protein